MDIILGIIKVPFLLVYLLCRQTVKYYQITIPLVLATIFGHALSAFIKGLGF